MTNKNLGCEAFLAKMNAYLDSELTPSEREIFEAHAQTCPECQKELEIRTGILTALAELDEGIAVPAACGQAWREAVRAEAARKGAKRGSGRYFARAAIGLAACAALLFTQTAILRASGNLASKSRETIYEMTDTAYETDPSYASYDASARNGYSLSSDGSADGEIAGNYQDGTREQIVIRSATRAIETSAYDADYAILTDLVAEYDAYFETLSVTGRPLDVSDDTATGRKLKAVVRVPSESLDSFLTSATAIGSTVSASESALDISDSYYDTKSRLTSLRAQLDRLNEMYKDAKSVDDLIAIEQRVQEVQWEIESLEGNVASWDSQTKYASVSVTLDEVSEKDRIAAMSDTLGERMAATFKDSVNWLVGFLQDALVTLTMIAPQLVIWVPAALILYGVYRLIRRAVRKRK